MESQKIKSPNFQRLNALDEFDFRNLKKVGCNICQSNEKDFLFEEGVFKIFKCKNCGLIYVSPHPSDTELREYYKYFFSGAHSPDISKWRNIESFNQAYGLLNRFSKKPKNSVLEIGCGYGCFLELLKRKGYKNLTGIEPDIQISEEYKDENSGAEIINGDFVSHNFENIKYDVIVMLASLEHFLDPLQVLKISYDLLNEGGIMIIRVPCLEGFFRLNRLLGKKLVPFGAPRHLYDFNKNTLRKIIRAAGFKTIEVAIGANETASSFIYDKLIKIIKIIFFCGDKAGLEFLSLFSGSLIIVGKKQ